MHWKKIISSDPAVAESLQASLKRPFHPSLLKLLEIRGIKSDDQARSYFGLNLDNLHDPFLLKDMDKAVQRVITAMKNGEEILLYGDYDVDGTTSVALMRKLFDLLNYEVYYYIPNRFTEGYGLSFQGIDHAKEVNATLLISLDCGTKASEKIRYALSLGIETIVIDHHTTGDDKPVCFAMINPRQPDCGYPFKELPACGLALKFAMALCESLKNEPKWAGKIPDPLHAFADLVALSIACDIVPLVGENRILANMGLKMIKERPSAGVQALKNLATQPRTWDIDDLVFFMGPRINSAGRLYEAAVSVDLLLGHGPDIGDFAGRLDLFNAERKILEKEIFDEALQKLANEPSHVASTVLWDDGWSKGIIGIVASKLIENLYRPTILLTYSEGKWVGSGRSVEGFDLYSALDACSSYLDQFGGHRYAAGLTLSTANLEPFKQAFDEYVQQNWASDQRQPAMEFLDEIPLTDINASFLKDIRLFGPFGPENLEPVFVSRSVYIHDCKVLKDNHVKFSLQQGPARFSAIGFGLADKWRNAQSHILDIAYQPFVSHYGGQQTVELRLKDFIPAD